MFRFVGHITYSYPSSVYPSWPAFMNVARIYLRVSTEEQDLTRQAEIEHSARAAGYYIAGV